MFVLLFTVSFILAAGVASGVAWLSKDPIEVILHGSSRRISALAYRSI